jgi:hypothetical protein
MGLAFSFSELAFCDSRFVYRTCPGLTERVEIDLRGVRELAPALPLRGLARAFCGGR